MLGFLLSCTRNTLITNIMKLRVLYHGHCFDGVASAATFTRFYKSRINHDAQISYTGLVHRPNNELFEAEMFDADESAIVDFKYAASAKLTWWFDHHQSAFLTKEDEQHFFDSPDGKATGKKFWDATRKSCCEFIYDTLRATNGFTDESLQTLIQWAHIIDGAFYTSPAQAVELKEPALQLMQVIESTAGDDFNEHLIRELSLKSLEQVATSAEVEQRFRPIYAAHLKTLEAIRRQAKLENSVVFFDLIEDDIEGFNKFIPYHLFPDATYTVALTRGRARTKISVGSNPWAKKARTHNIALICERYGGGGHPVVGAISFKPDETTRARQVADEVVEELSK